MRSSFILLLCSTSLAVLGQARNANWVYADGMWMAFTDSSMTQLPSPYSGPARSSCISDTTGQFLLLVDDTGIRDAQFNLLPGASALELGWTNPAANFMILPKPGAPTRYCILVNEDTPASRAGYVEVDLADNSGTGGVVGNGTTWYMEHATSKLTATTDAGEAGYWIVQHADSGDAFHVFHLTALGLNPVPVTSNAGRIYLPETPDHINMDRCGHMKFSFQGDKLAAITNGTDLDTNAVELFYFDRSNGSLTFWAHLGPQQYYLTDSGTLNPMEGKPFLTGCEFSQDGLHLFLANVDTLQSQEIIGVQMDLMNPDPVAIQHATFRLMGFGNHQFDGYDPFGSETLFGINGLLYQRKIHYPNSFPAWWIHEWENIPAQMGDIDNFGWPFIPEYSTSVAGFPNLCKRYLDSGPITTAVPTTELEAVLRVLPNPSNGRILVRLNGVSSTAKASILDAIGRTAPGTWTLRNGDNAIDISGLANGAYVLRVEFGDAVRFVRIAKQ